MTSSELREKFLKFFEERGHKIVPSSSLLPEDTSVLLTTAGMQQFKSYYLEEESPYGQNIVSSQKCFRTSDIEEVGDEKHLTFFEMLGNFSFGGYFKKEAIEIAKEFLDSIKIEIDYVTVFAGDENTPKDEKSAEVWRGLGFTEEKGNLRFCNKEENFWGPTGQEGPCGPTTEIYVKGIEIWNIVFNEYYCKDNKLKKLKKPGIDTGMGLERLAIISQDKETIFETDLFLSIIEKIEDLSSNKYEDHKREFRIIADHIRGSVFLIADGVRPDNVEQGYILRRLLRRAIRLARVLELPSNFLILLGKIVISEYKGAYPEMNHDILAVMKEEREKFELTLENGLREFEKLEIIDGKEAFKLYASYGFPLELTKELALEKGIEINEDDFDSEFKKHQEISRTAAAGKFKGGLADTKEETIKLHTAHHLLLAALQKVLGTHVKQKGSNINSDRLRIDFVHPQKMTKEEIEAVEKIVNDKIEEGLKVIKREMSKEEAEKIGAEMEFGGKYDDTVSVYFIEDEKGNVFSKEFCGGPHVNNTSELGSFKIKKEQSSSAGVRRIKAILE